MRRHLIYFLICVVFRTYSQIPGNDPHWSLVLEDNFDSLNTNLWDVANNFDHYSGEADNFDEGEPQVYTNRPENISTNNGNLVIRMKRETYTCPSNAEADWGCSRQARYNVPYQYTSAWIQTKEKFNYKYGYVEARIKLPYGNAFWPAFWTLKGEKTDSPDTVYREIDIFEMLPGRVEFCDHLTSHQQIAHSKYLMTTNIHDDQPTCEPACNCARSYEVNSIDDYTQFHTYGLEWSPNRIIWYVDGKVVRSTQTSRIELPQRVILNFALNTPSQVQVESFTPFPSEMIVDYFRMYKLKKDCENSIVENSYNFSTHDNLLKQRIEIGSQGSFNALSSNENVVLRASQSVEIKGSFEVPVGAKFLMNAGDDCYETNLTYCDSLFQTCDYLFANYDNTKKKEILLGPGGCSIVVAPLMKDVNLVAEKVTLKDGVTLTSYGSNYNIKCKAENCE